MTFDGSVCVTTKRLAWIKQELRDIGEKIGNSKRPHHIPELMGWWEFLTSGHEVDAGVRFEVGKLGELLVYIEDWHDDDWTRVST